MMNRHTLCCAIIGLGIGLAPLTASEAPALRGEGDGLWGVGVTGWMCAQPPCPWRGVFAVAEDGTRSRPTDIGDMPEPPPMRGDPQDITRIQTNYAAHGCLLVEGQFDGMTLTVDRIIGDCQP